MGGLTSRTSVDPSSTSASMSLRTLLFYIHTHQHTHHNNNYNMIILLYMGGSSIDIMLLDLNVYDSGVFRRNYIFARKYCIFVQYCTTDSTST